MATRTFRPMQFSVAQGHYRKLMKKGKAKYKVALWTVERNYLQGDRRGYPWEDFTVWKHIPDEQGGMTKRNPFQG